MRGKHSARGGGVGAGIEKENATKEGVLDQLQCNHKALIIDWKFLRAEDPRQKQILHSPEPTTTKRKKPRSTGPTVEELLLEPDESTTLPRLLIFAACLALRLRIFAGIPCVCVCVMVMVVAAAAAWWWWWW